jgi:hypothetical protein
MLLDSPFKEILLPVNLNIKKNCIQNLIKIHARFPPPYLDINSSPPPPPSLPPCAQLNVNCSYKMLNPPPPPPRNY